MNADEKDAMAVELALYKSLYEENYFGCYESLIDFAKELLIGNNEMPEWLPMYIDWERIAKDWQLNGDLVAIETVNGFHVFLQLDKEMDV
jgi:antirestriction protein